MHGRKLLSNTSGAGHASTLVGRVGGWVLKNPTQHPLAGADVPCDAAEEARANHIMHNDDRCECRLIILFSDAMQNISILFYIA
jgi:hypothetical protein